MAKQLDESMFIDKKNMKIDDKKYAYNLVIKEERKVFNLNVIISYNSNEDKFNVKLVII